VVLAASRFTQAAHSLADRIAFSFTVERVTAFIADAPEIVFPMPFAAAELTPGRMAFSAGSAKAF
jgi:hypothetical protein